MKISNFLWNMLRFGEYLIEMQENILHFIL
jgi:hypothetical protein